VDTSKTAVPYGMSRPDGIGMFITADTSADVGHRRPGWRPARAGGLVVAQAVAGAALREPRQSWGEVPAAGAAEAVLPE
jgi:hypothetical protein